MKPLLTKKSIEKLEDKKINDILKNIDDNSKIIFKNFVDNRKQSIEFSEKNKEIQTKYFKIRSAYCYLCANPKYRKSLIEFNNTKLKLIENFVLNSDRQPYNMQVLTWLDELLDIFSKKLKEDFRLTKAQQKDFDKSLL